MFIISAILALLLAAAHAHDYSSEHQEAKCTERLQRRAWHTLSATEKHEYIQAELCLMYQIPASTGLIAAVSRFDDLIKSHQVQSMLVHKDGLFFPFHRLLVHAHEYLLRTECEYSGAQPYWDEARDAGSFSSATILDPESGFGGDGKGPDGCLADGPFAKYTLHTGPDYENTVHCLSRAINNTKSQGSAQQNIDACMKLDKYADAWPCMENSPHTAGHQGIGGEMASTISSPGDPIFYLHHAFLDRVWWQWQEGALPARLSDFAGYTTEYEPVTGWVNATLDDELNMFGIIPNATVRDLMDIRGGRLCYEYVDPY